jgi:hypothetical protein
MNFFYLTLWNDTLYFSGPHTCGISPYVYNKSIMDITNKVYRNKMEIGTEALTEMQEVLTRFDWVCLCNICHMNI